MTISSRPPSLFNDQISSLKIHPGYSLLGYVDDDYEGQSHIFYGFISQLSSTWNDKLSSWKCIKTEGKGG